MATKQVLYKISETGAKKTEQSLGGVNKSIMGMAKAAGVALVSYQALSKGLKATVGASIKQEEIFRKLQTSTELAGKKWKDAKGELDGLFASLQATTRYGDTDSAQMLTKLIEFTGDYETAVKNLPLVLDMASTSMFDAQSASRYLGMALSGNVEMLGRYIPELKTSNNELLKNMTNAEKAEYAMNLLNEKFGGAAQKDLETTIGQYQQIQNYMGDIGETIGDITLPMINSVMKAYVNWIGIIEQKESVIAGDLYKKGSAMLDNYLDNIDKTGKSLKESMAIHEENMIILASVHSQYEKGIIGLGDYNLALADMRASMVLLNKPIVNVVTGINEFIPAIKEAGITIEEYIGDDVIPLNEWQEFSDILNEITIEYKEWGDAPPLFSEKELKQLRAAENIMYGFTDSLSRAVFDGGNLGDVVVHSLERIATQVLSMSVTWGLLKLLPGGSAVGGLFGYISRGLGFADGGIVPEYHSTGGFAKGTDTVPAMLTPGEVILNAGQQKNVADKMQGVNITINGDFLGSEEQADKLAFIIEQRSKQNFNNIAVN